MHRSYADHRPGHRYVQIELTEDEVHGLIADLNPKTLTGHHYAQQLIELLSAARYDFNRGAPPPRHARRAVARQLTADGIRTEEIARRIDVSKRTVNRWQAEDRTP